MNNVSLQDILRYHSQGKLNIVPKYPIKTQKDLSIVYTPGVAKVSSLIHKNKSKAFEYTMRANTVAIVSDGSAVLGLGNIGPEAALPVMEGKAAIFKEFAGINAVPICLNTQNIDEIVNIIKAISVNFAAINLEDISAPRCFEIEKRLTQELDIPVMHDDQHGTAIVLLAALLGALHLYPKDKLNILVLGVGAAGVAIIRLLLEAQKHNLLNIAQIRAVDSKGLIYKGRNNLTSIKQEIATLTNQTQPMSLSNAMKGMNVFIGVSGPNLLQPKDIKNMAKNPFVFAMANPIPEIDPQEAYKAGAVIVGTGRSDYKNQINNALAYPGVFKGLINSKIKQVTPEIKIAAAKAIFEYHKPNLSPDNILPSVLDKKVPKVIAKAMGST